MASLTMSNIKKLYLAPHVVRPYINPQKGILHGMVVRTGHLDKTATVIRLSVKEHPRLLKNVVLSRKYLVHDEFNELVPSDQIIFQNASNISPRKRHIFKSILWRDPFHEINKERKKIVAAEIAQMRNRVSDAIAESGGLQKKGTSSIATRVPQAPKNLRVFRG